MLRETLQAQLQAITTTSRRCSCGMLKAPVSDPATELVLDAPLVSGSDLKDLVAAASLPADSPDECLCERCKTNTDHAATTRFSVPASQRVLTVFFKRTADSLSKPRVPVSNIETLSFPNIANGQFELAAGIIHYGNSVASGHYCSFHRAPDKTWRYTNDANSFVVNFSDIVAAAPLVFFYVRLTHAGER